ncbi:hypothetical protein IV203_005322 [Nitzschia inconspicua]|uniref:Uncharacterized protein n=1 Tax=Nitzschia inconspicua TaxID=303405 RepID=A0A9K3KN90_9STRA|nr:hypothetical protein IV203_005322 [Nitzschia inconspicua]
MSRIVEETSEEEDEEEEDEEDEGDAYVVKAKSNHMISKKARDLPMDRIVKDDEGALHTKTPSVAPSNVENGELLAKGSLSLVLLLVDPATLRFELLQLEFASPQDVTVAEVLEQIQDPLWRPLPFVGVLDRQGNAYKAKKLTKKQQKQQQIASISNTPRKLKLFGGGKKEPETPPKVGPFLEQACQHRPPRSSPDEPHRDVLVALLKNTSVEKMHQLARPILGEAKVVAMLEQNGYLLDGWKQDKRREATLQESRLELSNTSEKKTSWQTMTWSLKLLFFLLVVMSLLIAASIKSGIRLPMTTGEWKSLSNALVMSFSEQTNDGNRRAASKEGINDSSAPRVLMMGGMEVNSPTEL